MYTIIISFIVLIAYPCRGSILNNAGIESGIKQFKNISDLSKSTCKSSNNECYCLFSLEEPFKLTVGFKLKYIPSALALEAALFIDDRVFNATISIKNPPLGCILPLSSQLNICLKLYNFNPMIPNCISGCVNLVAIFYPARAKLHFGCFHIPLQKGVDMEQWSSTTRNYTDKFLLLISAIFSLYLFNPFKNDTCFNN